MMTGFNTQSVQPVFAWPHRRWIAFRDDSSSHSDARDRSVDSAQRHDCDQPDQSGEDAPRSDTAESGDRQVRDTSEAGEQRASDASKSSERRTHTGSDAELARTRDASASDDHDARDESAFSEARMRGPSRVGLGHDRPTQVGYGQKAARRATARRVTSGGRRTTTALPRGVRGGDR